MLLKKLSGMVLLLGCSVMLSASAVVMVEYGTYGTANMKPTTGTPKWIYGYVQRFDNQMPIQLDRKLARVLIEVAGRRELSPDDLAVIFFNHPTGKEGGRRAVEILFFPGSCWANLLSALQEIGAKGWQDVSAIRCPGYQMEKRLLSYRLRPKVKFIKPLSRMTEVRGGGMAAGEAAGALSPAQYDPSWLGVREDWQVVVGQDAKAKEQIRADFCLIRDK